MAEVDTTNLEVLPTKCDAHALATFYVTPYSWGQEGHLYYQDGALYLCLPQSQE